MPVLHFDTVYWAPNWQERDRGEAHRMVREFMENPSWVIDGNYTKFEYERRMRESNQIIILDFPRLVCFFRAWKRYFRYRGRTRDDMGEGCPEKMDPEFMRWILWEGRTHSKRRKFQEIFEQYPKKTVVLRCQKDIDQYLEGLSC